MRKSSLIRSFAHSPIRRFADSLIRRFVHSLLIILLVAGCTILPHSTSPILKIGLIAPFEGLQRPEGYAALSAVKLALRQRNQAGGVAGYGVELVALNDDGDPTQAALQARKLAVDPAVVGVIGPLSRATVAAAAAPLTEAGLAWVIPAPASDVTVAQSPNAFRLFASDGALATALMAWAGASAQANGGRGRVMVPEIGLFAAPLAAAAADAGLLEPWTASSGEASAMLALGMDAEEAADFLRGSGEAAGQRCLLAGPEAAGAVTFQRIASDGLSLVWVTSYQEQPWPVEFVQGYQEMAGGPPDPAAALAYDAAQVLLDAIARSVRVGRAPGRAEVVMALREAQWRGLNGPVAFDHQGNWVDAPVHLYRATRTERFGSMAIKGVSCKS